MGATAGESNLVVELPDLEFPVAPDFNPPPARVDFQAMLKRIETTMPYRNAQPGASARRLAEKIDVEFVL